MCVCVSFTNSSSLFNCVNQAFRIQGPLTFPPPAATSQPGLHDSTSFGEGFGLGRLRHQLVARRFFLGQAVVGKGWCLYIICIYICIYIYIYIYIYTYVVPTKMVDEDQFILKHITPTNYENQFVQHLLSTCQHQQKIWCYWFDHPKDGSPPEDGWSRFLSTAEVQPAALCHLLGHTGRQWPGVSRKSASPWRMVICLRDS